MATSIKKIAKKAHHSKYVLLLMRHAKSLAPSMGCLLYTSDAADE